MNNDALNVRMVHMKGEARCLLPLRPIGEFDGVMQAGILGVPIDWVRVSFSVD